MFREWRRSEKLFDEIEKMIEEMDAHMRSHASEPFVYGFSMHVGADGMPHMEHFGNVGVPERREPFISSMIDDKSSELKITAEMPGIQKKDIEVDATEDEVIIRAEGEKRYYKSVKTPCVIDPESAKAKYNNGVLEVTLELKEPKPKGKKVKIE